MNLSSCIEERAVPTGGAGVSFPPNKGFRSKSPDLPFLLAIFTFSYSRNPRRRIRCCGVIEAFNLIHLFMKTFLVNRYSSVMGATPVFSPQIGSYTPKEVSRDDPD